jgi:hypothetical protein
MFFGVGDEGFLELGAIYSKWRQLTGGGCRGRKTKEKPVQLQQKSWDAGTEVTPSTEATATEYDRWVNGTNV